MQGHFSHTHTQTHYTLRLFPILKFFLMTYGSQRVHTLMIFPPELNPQPRKILPQGQTGVDII